MTASTPMTGVSKAPGYPRSVSTLLSTGRTTYLEYVFDDGKFKVVGVVLEDSLQVACSLRGADHRPDSVISLQQCVYDPSTKEA